MGLRHAGTHERPRRRNRARIQSVGAGCHASGFILLVAPLVSAGIIAPDAFLSATSVTGYSGGGKKMISAYETAGRTAFDSLAMPLPYAHSQTHKHLPEMTIAAGLARPPVFQPIVGSFRCGMLVTVPLDLGLLGTTKETVQSVWAKHYAGSPVVRPSNSSPFLRTAPCASTRWRDTTA